MSWLGMHLFVLVAKSNGPPIALPCRPHAVYCCGRRLRPHAQPVTHAQHRQLLPGGQHASSGMAAGQTPGVRQATWVCCGSTVHCLHLAVLPDGWGCATLLLRTGYQCSLPPASMCQPTLPTATLLADRQAARHPFCMLHRVVLPGPDLHTAGGGLHSHGGCRRGYCHRWVPGPLRAAGMHRACIVCRWEACTSQVAARI